MFNKRLYRNGQYKCFLVKDLDEAYSLGLYCSRMHRDEFMERVTKYNPDLRWFANKTHRALWDISAGDNGFICGITHHSIMPKYSLMEYDFSKDRKLNYSDMYGNATGQSAVINPDENKYTVLARGWENIFAIVERNGYQIDRRGL